MDLLLVHANEHAFTAQVDRLSARLSSCGNRDRSGQIRRRRGRLALLALRPCFRSRRKCGTSIHYASCVMRAERWQQIADLYEAALDREPGARIPFLVDACASDEELRREVVSLVEAHEQSGNFLEEPPLRSRGACARGPAGRSADWGPASALRNPCTARRGRDGRGLSGAGYAPGS